MAIYSSIVKTPYFRRNIAPFVANTPYDPAMEDNIRQEILRDRAQGIYFVVDSEEEDRVEKLRNYYDSKQEDDLIEFLKAKFPDTYTRFIKEGTGEPLMLSFKNITKNVVNKLSGNMPRLELSLIDATEAEDALFQELKPTIQAALCECEKMARLTENCEVVPRWINGKMSYEVLTRNQIQVAVDPVNPTFPVALRYKTEIQDNLDETYFVYWTRSWQITPEIILPGLWYITNESVTDEFIPPVWNYDETNADNIITNSAFRGKIYQDRYLRPNPYLDATGNAILPLVHFSSRYSTTEYWEWSDQELLQIQEDINRFRVQLIEAFVRQNNIQPVLETLGNEKDSSSPIRTDPARTLKVKPFISASGDAPIWGRAYTLDLRADIQGTQEFINREISQYYSDRNIPRWKDSNAPESGYSKRMQNYDLDNWLQNEQTMQTKAINELWNIIKIMVNHHASFPNDEWAYNSERVQLTAKIDINFKPKQYPLQAIEQIQLDDWNLSKGQTNVIDIYLRNNPYTTKQEAEEAIKENQRINAIYGATTQNPFPDESEMTKINESIEEDTTGE